MCGENRSISNQIDTPTNTPTNTPTQNQFTNYELEQIEEMAQEMYSLLPDSYDVNERDCRNAAEEMFAQGYCKQSEGEWQIKTEIHRMLDDVDEEIYVECPFCKRTFWVPYEFEDKKIFEYAREHYPYCNCGAKMKGGVE